MALAPSIQILKTSCLYVNPFQVERGGVLSLVNLSGINYAIYEQSVSNNSVPLGVMLHDQEEVNCFRGPAPSRVRNAFHENTHYPYLIKGIIITNAIHPSVTSIVPGSPAYLANSGLISNTTIFSNKQIGTFDSILNDSSLGLISNQSSFRAAGNFAIRNPQPIMIATAGWARIRIHV